MMIIAVALTIWIEDWKKFSFKATGTTLLVETQLWIRPQLEQNLCFIIASARYEDKISYYM